jgi:hypothetical protein
MKKSPPPENPEILARAKAMQAAVGNSTDTLLLGMLVGAFGLNRFYQPDISKKHLKKIDNTQADGTFSHEGHLQHLMQVASLPNMKAAQAFSDKIEETLLQMYIKLAKTEQEMAVRIPDDQLSGKLMEVISIEGRKERAADKERSLRN